MLLFRAFFDPINAQSTIEKIPLPSSNYMRVQIRDNSFAEWLRDLSLQKSGSDVLNYRGGIFKTGKDTSVAFVVDMNIEGKRLEQCMDVLVRFYADYLWEKKQTKNLNLPLPGGYWLNWKNWGEGYRPNFSGIDVTIKKSSKPDSSHQSYISYLNTVYSESHTQQFFHAYLPINREEVKIGDMIIRKGTKGHAVMIVDLALNKQGEMIALIGNGDTPACQFFILKYSKDSPWVPLYFDKEALDLPLKRKMSWEGLRRFDLPRE